MRIFLAPVLVSLGMLAACSADSTYDITPSTPPSSPHFAERTRSYLGALMAERRGFDSAARAYMTALHVQPDSLSLRMKAYSYALVAGRMDDALQIAQTFQPADDPGSIAWLLLAVNAVRHQQYEQALDYVALAQKDTPDLLHFQLLKNQIELAQGRSIEDIEKELYAFKPHDFLKARLHYHLGLLELSAGKQAAALRNLTKAQDLEPGALFTVRALGRVLEASGQHDEAVAIYRSFTEKNPDALLLQDVEDRLARGEWLATMPSFSLEDQVGRVLFGFSMLMWAQQLDVPARQLLNMALWLSDQPLYQFYAGTMEEQAADPVAAYKHYTHVPTDAAGGLAAQLRMADILFQQGKEDEGVARLKALQAQYPDRILLDRLLAQMYYQKKDYATAITYYDALFSKLEEPESPEHVNLYFGRGSSYERLRDFHKAEKDLEQAIALEPDNPFLLNYLGYMWLDADMKLEKAFAYVSKAAVLRPRDPSIMDSLGWAYYKRGQYARALLFLERAAELEPMDATIIEHLGDVHSKLGHAEKAQDFWQQAMDLGPVGPYERERLQKKLKRR